VFAQVVITVTVRLNSDIPYTGLGTFSVPLSQAVATLEGRNDPAYWKNS